MYFIGVLTSRLIEMGHEKLVDIQLKPYAKDFSHISVEEIVFQVTIPLL